MSNEKKNDGGPAFPTMDTWWAAEDGATYAGHSEGLTIRDYFAAKAMQGLIIQLDIHRSTAEGYADGMDGIPVLAYSIADAMLKAREE